MGSPNMAISRSSPQLRRPRTFPQVCLPRCFAHSVQESGRKSGSSHEQFKLPKRKEWLQAAAASAPLRHAA
eukprot:15479714-Alexandrium_andersonii.AAC.1